MLPTICFSLRVGNLLRVHTPLRMSPQPTLLFSENRAKLATRLDLQQSSPKLIGHVTQVKPIRLSWIHGLELRNATNGPETMWTGRARSTEKRNPQREQWHSSGKRELERLRKKMFDSCLLFARVLIFLNSCCHVYPWFPWIFISL